MATKIKIPNSTFVYVIGGQLPLTLSSISINNGAETTYTNVVSVKINYTGVPVYYRISENNSFSDTSWQSFQTSTVQFTLSSGYSTKTLYVQLKNSSGTVITTISNDSIIYLAPVVETAPTLSSISINNGADSTSNLSVSINFNTSGTVTEYIISESSNFSGSVWITYTNPVSFTLSGGDGVKTVYAKIKNTIGESSVVSDSITLDTTTVVDELTATLSSSTISASGESLTLSVYSNIDWTITKNTGTLNYNFSSTSGNGNATITITVDENTSTTSNLTGSFSVHGNSISIPLEITQSAASVTETIRSVIAFNTTTPQTVVIATSNNDTINNIFPVSNASYSAKQLYSSSGVLISNWYVNFNQNYYTINDTFGSSGSNIRINAAANATELDDSGIYAASIYSICSTVSNKLYKSRLSFALPVGSYQIRLLWSTSASLSTTEAQRLTCYYGIFQNATELTSAVVGTTNFNPYGNKQYNNTLTFSITDSQYPIDLAWWSTSNAFDYRPGLNLIEITKLS